MPKSSQSNSLYTPTDLSSCGIGLIVNLKAKPLHQIVKDSTKVLINLSHRGAVGSDAKLGDGSGFMFAIPDEFFRHSIPNLPPLGAYGVGMLFLYGSEHKHIAQLTKISKTYNCRLFYNRTVPIKKNYLSSSLSKSIPTIVQCFFQATKPIMESSLNKILYQIKIDYETWLSQQSNQLQSSHIASISTRVIIYKALVLPKFLHLFYQDLTNKHFKSHFSLIHSRYSTNTLPSWALVQPCQFLAHNGEINTLKGNINSIKTLLPKYNSKQLSNNPIRFSDNHIKSDSMWLNKWVEFLYHSGKSLADIFSFCFPQSYSQLRFMSRSIKSFFRYHAAQIEPWSGPAGLVFSDGITAGACLDRFGLRPLRYQLFNDDYFVLASEIGVLKDKKQTVIKEGRLSPAEMLEINLETGKILFDLDIKKNISSRFDYSNAIKKKHIQLPSWTSTSTLNNRNSFSMSSSHLNRLHTAFGYYKDDLNMIISTMASTGKETVYSMGADVPLAVCSYLPKRLFDYFKQRFAQVSNPALDPIRESIHLSLRTFIGSKHSIFANPTNQPQQFFYTHSILDPHAFTVITNNKRQGLQSKRVYITQTTKKTKSFKQSLTRICLDVDLAIDHGASIIILSDKHVNINNLALPSLLVCSAVHHYLIRQKKRHHVSIIIETAEVFSSHHVACLFGFGANAVYPYLAFNTIHNLVEHHYIPDISYQTAFNNFILAMDQGVLKIMSKLGIPTLRGYIGSKQFDCIGISQAVLSDYFEIQSSLIEGLTLNDIKKEVLQSHKEAYNSSTQEPLINRSLKGLYHYRKNGEFHAWNPSIIVALQQAVRLKSYSKFQDFSELCNLQTKNHASIRGFFELVKQNKPPTIPSQKQIQSIIKTFSTGAMSFGSLSPEAHQTLAIGMNSIGGFSNSGEGGELSRRLKTKGKRINLNSRIKQVASGRFGVTSDYLMSADIIQIKMAQGAKPGEGGQIPGHKVIGDIAEVRFTKAGTELISPPPHHDIYSIEDLKQLIYDLKSINPTARVSVKLVAESGVGTIAVGVAKADADIILISGHDGGTGASLLGSIHQAGIPWEIGLAETHQALTENKLRHRVELHVDGGFKTAQDIIIAAILGANGFGFSTAALVSLGCVMVRQCHKNTCPTGIATQDPTLRQLFKGDPEHIKQWAIFLAQDVAQLLHQLDVDSLKDLINRTDLLTVVLDNKRWKTKRLNFKRLLHQVPTTKKISKLRKHDQKNNLDHHIFNDILTDNINTSYPITNVDRSVGARLVYLTTTHQIKKTLYLSFHGYAGQSFGAFLTKQFHLHCEGGSNDYVGKSLSGGAISMCPEKSSIKNELLVGNACFYGATKGFAYIAGKAGERFAVRNSGATLVVEGMGDHGCEYMTGGVVLSLSSVGLNFGAGMSGGCAYIYDPSQSQNTSMYSTSVSMTSCNSDDLSRIKKLLKKHKQYTKSKIASSILNHWEISSVYFVKIA